MPNGTELNFLELCAGSHRLTDVAVYEFQMKSLAMDAACLHMSKVPENVVLRIHLIFSMTLSGSPPVGLERKLELSLFGQGLPYCNLQISVRSTSLRSLKPSQRISQNMTWFNPPT